MKHIKQKITLLVIICIVVISLMFGLISSFVLYKSTKRQLTDITAQATTIAALDLENTIKTYTYTVNEIASSNILTNKSNSISQKKTFIDEKVKQYYMRSGGIIDLNGICELTGKDYSKEPFFLASIKGDSYLSRPYFNEEKNDMYLIVSAPIITDGKVSGVLYFLTDNKILSDAVNNMVIGKKDSAYILDKNGYTIAYNEDINTVYEEENAVLAAQSPDADKTMKELAKIEQKMINGETGFGCYNYYGEECYQGYAPVKYSDGWSVAITLNANEYSKDANTGCLIIVITAITFIGLGVFVGRSYGYIIGTPIAKCSDRLISLSEGDLKSPVPVTKSKDEIGSLLKGTEIMVHSMSDMILDIEYYLKEIGDGNLNVQETNKNYPGDFSSIKDYLQLIMNSLNETLSSINQVADNVLTCAESVSSGSEALSQSSTEQASSIQELAATITEISNNIKINATNAQNAKEKTENVRETIKLSNNQMANMKNAMNEISNTSNEINKIIKSIDDIAFQTNILALNAAVEAARAGSSGKGFAVVADEVRNLAQKSAAAAKDTAVLIQNSIQAVQNGSIIVDDTVNMMNKVTKDVNDVVEDITNIAIASNEQSVSSEQITLGIEQISSAVQSNSATSEENAATSIELHTDVTKLKKQLDKFIFKK